MNCLVSSKRLGGADEAEVAFVDEIGEGEAQVAEVAAYRDHELEVAADELVHGMLVAGADATGQFGFFGGGEGFVATDFTEVQGKIAGVADEGNGGFEFFGVRVADFHNHWIYQNPGHVTCKTGYREIAEKERISFK